MKIIGANLLIKTVETIFLNKVEAIEQTKLISNTIQLNNAPKILKQDCKINWNNNSNAIVNKIRGLNPIPAANTILISENATEFYLKIFKAKAEIFQHNDTIGKTITDNKTFLKISTIDGYVYLLEIQVAGKNKMTIAEFLRGHSINNKWKFI